MCMLSNDIYDYFIVSQGKTTIPNVDDGEECVLTDVSPASESRRLSKYMFFIVQLSRRKQPANRRTVSILYRHVHTGC